MGILLTLLCAFLVTGKDVISKRLASEVTSTTSTFASFAYALPFYGIAILIAAAFGLEDFRLLSGFFLYTLARAVSDTGAEWCKMKSLAMAEMSLVSSFFSLYPLILLVVSPLLTGDPLTAHAIPATFMIVLGTLVILYKPRTSAEPTPWKAIGFALTAAVFFSVNTAMDRVVVRTASPLMSGFVMTLMSGVFLLPALLRIPNARQELIENARFFSARGLLELLFMVTKLSALRFLSAPMVVGVMRSSVLLSVISGHMFFDEKHFRQRMCGAGLVCLGVVYLLMP